MRIGLIRVLTVKDKGLLNSHGRLIEKLFEGVTVVSRCIEGQPEGIHDKETERTAIPKVVQLGCQFKDIEALIVSCCADPGVKELRQKLEIPVVGAGASAASVALSYSDRVGVLGLIEEVPEVVARILGNALVGNVVPRGVKTTLDLMSKGGKEEILRSAKELVEMGAEVIVPACTGFSTIRICQRIERETEVVTIDPVIASGLMVLYACLRRRQA